LPLADKNRPAIVLQVLDSETVLVIYGTGTARELPRVEVRPESREGKALGLYKPTYFYTTGVRVAAMAVLIRRDRRCPPELFGQLRAIAQRPGP
jgi:hypothetical protein